MQEWTSQSCILRHVFFLERKIVITLLYYNYITEYLYDPYLSLFSLYPS